MVGVGSGALALMGLARTDCRISAIVERIRHFLLVRHKENWLLFFRFGLVGGSGVLVNMITIIICNKLGPSPHGVALGLPMTEFNIRWYHVYATIAFLVANLWNFQLNRWWTFKSAKHASWIREYLPFLAVGLLGLVANLAILTLLLKEGSPLALPTSFFDDSSGFRTRLYWAQLIAICIVTPLSFVLNKLWTFSAVRGIKQLTDETAQADVADEAAEAGEAGETAAAGPSARVDGTGEKNEHKRDTPAGTA